MNLDSNTSREWRIDAPVTRAADDRPSSHKVYLCSSTCSSELHTHVAKVLIDNPNEQQWRHFEREAFIGLRLSSPAALNLCDFCLTADSPRLVYARLTSTRIDVWLQQQPQFVTRWQWVTIALNLLTQLQAVHHLGYVHGHVRPEHVWVDNWGGVQLIGWGHCQPVGGHFAARGRSDEYDPPELRGNAAEASSSLDVFSAAAVIEKLSSGQLAQAPVGKWMQAADPYDRPTSSELVELFASYQQELNGSFHRRQVA